MIVQEAMFYASMGWRVIPVDPNGKAPLLQEWEKLATTDEDQIERWWERWPSANVGIVFGPDSGIIDVECDDADAEKAFQELFDEGHESTPCYKSKRGKHRFFKFSKDLPHQDLAVFKHKGIEFRTGANGKGAQSVAPPSTIDGVTREWILHPSECDVAEIPGYVIAKLANEAAGIKPGQFETKSDEEWQEIYGGSTEGDRNTNATKFIGKMLRLTTPLDRDYTWNQTLLWNKGNMPPLPEKELRDTYGSIFRKEIERREKEVVQQQKEIDERTTIEVTHDEHDVIDETLAAMASDPTIYHRAGELVHLIPEKSTTEDDGIERLAGTPRIRDVSKGYLRERLARLCWFYKHDKELQKKQVQPPAFAVDSIHTRGFWHTLRQITGITETPVLRPDGTILDTPGWDDSTELLYQPSGEVPAVSPNPTQADAIAATETLLELVQDFPFGKPEHKSTWLASLLTVLSRRAFSGPAPLFLIDANTRGSGKSLLTDVIACITTGRNMPRFSNPRDDEEARKRITSLALAGDPLVLIDNIASTLGGASLDAALTSTTWKDRLLGGNRIVEAPLRIVWFATGNNVILEADTSRRVCHCRLDSPDENPEERTGFKHPNLLTHVRENRLKLLTAALTILRAFVVAGKPDQGLKPWGSFEGWSSFVRNALVWAGLPDPGETRRELAESADRDAAALRMLFAGWSEIDPDGNGLTAAEIAKRLDDRPGAYEGFRSALSELCNTQGRGMTGRVIGNQLRRFRGRVIGNRRLEMLGGGHKKINLWRVSDSDVRVCAASAVSSGNISTRDSNQMFRTS